MTPLRAKVRDTVEDQLSFGGRMPWGAGLLLAVTVVASLVAAFGSRHGSSLFDLAALVPADVLRGQVWRPFTHLFVEPSAWGLFFTGLLYWWFGSDLARAWGSTWFLKLFLGLGFASSLAVVLLAKLDPSIADQRYLGTLPITGALVMAWGFTFPDRYMRLWFFLPVRGLVVAWATLILTVLYAAYTGWEHELPELLLELGVFAYLFRDKVEGPVRRLRGQLHRTEKPRAERAARKKRAAAAAHLKVVEDIDDELGDLSGDEDLKRRIDDAMKRATTPRDDGSFGPS